MSAAALILYPTQRRRQFDRRLAWRGVRCARGEVSEGRHAAYAHQMLHAGPGRGGGIVRVQSGRLCSVLGLCCVGCV